MSSQEPTWQQSSQIFNDQAVEYDSWFEESLLFDIELAALQEITTPLAEPKLELGVGPGRFAEKLGVMVGVDPAHAPLELAAKRIPAVVQGVGEQLPLAAGSMATAYILLTLCFTQQPQQVVAEARRILQPGGHLVLGTIPLDSPWGQYLQAKKEADHPFYRHARFFEVRQLVQWLVGEGFEAREIRTSLFQSPEELTAMEHSRHGLVEDAGFVIIVAQKI